jgi:hypothetical protein
MKKIIPILLMIYALSFSSCEYDSGLSKETSTAEIGAVTTEPSTTEINVTTTKGEPNPSEIVDYVTPDEDLIWVTGNLQTVIYFQKFDVDLLPLGFVTQCLEISSIDIGVRYNIDVKYTELYSVDVATWDMNNDGIDDYFILPRPVGFHSNAIPPLYLFLSYGDTYNIIRTPLETETFINILNSKTNGCYDLLWDTFGSVLYFDGENTYISEQKGFLKAFIYPPQFQDNIVILRFDIPYSYGELCNNYYLKACLFDIDYNAKIIITSNDEQFNEIIYSKPPINGTYLFHIKISDLNDIDLDNILIELKYVEII